MKSYNQTQTSQPDQHKPYLCLLLLLVILGNTAAIKAQISRKANVAGIDVTMALDKTNITIGEPVILSITTENVSPLPIMEVSTNYQLPEGNNLEIKVQPPGELPARYLGGIQEGVYSIFPLKLTRNQPQSVDTLLLFDRTHPDGRLFSKPGVYELTANWKLGLRGNTESFTVALPPTKITVTEPRGLDAEVLNFLDKPEYMLSLQLEATPTTGILDHIAEAANRFPLTSLGALALRTEGMNYTRIDNKESRAKAAQLLQNYLANGVEIYNPDAIAWEIAAIYHRNQEYDLAREWIFYLKRNYPTSTRIRPEDALIYYYDLAPTRYASGVPWYLLKTPWEIPGEVPPASLKPREADK